MSETVYIEIEIQLLNEINFINLCNSDGGFALNKQQVSLISAEWMIATGEDDTVCFHLWEKWESQEHLNTYFQIPERGEGSQFEAAMKRCAAGESRFCQGQPTDV